MYAYGNNVPSTPWMFFLESCSESLKARKYLFVGRQKKNDQYEYDLLSYKFSYEHAYCLDKSELRIAAYLY